MSGLSRTKRVVRWLDDKFYPGYQNNWDDDLFAEEVRKHLSSNSVILDLGAGAGIVETLNFRGEVKKVCGLDPDERVLDNVHLDEAKVGFGESIPWGSDTFDVVFTVNVLEHLERPQAVFDEVSRVLKPGGRFLAKTPNRRHYVPLAARTTPLWFHRFYNGLRGRAAEDTFPTYYLANSPEDVRHYARNAGLVVKSVRLVEGRPEYLRVHPLTYFAGIAYERAVNASDRLKKYRVLLVGKMKLPEEEGKIVSSIVQTRGTRTFE